jgi:hypothetical protein
VSESERSTTYAPRNSRLVGERVSGMRVGRRDPVEDSYSFLSPELALV